MALLTRAGQGFEYDFLTTNTFTIQLVSGNPALAGTLHVEMVRLNRPCSNNVLLTCGKPFRNLQEALALIYGNKG